MWIKERPERISCIGTGNWTDPEHTMEDTVLLLCKTRSEKLMRVRIDMLSKRPHSMTNYTLQGTKGAYESRRRPGEGDWIWLEDFCQDPDVWVPLKEFEAEYMPEIWRDPPPEAVSAGHGGGDYFEVMDFVDRGARAQTAADRHPRGDGHDPAGAGQPGFDPPRRRVVGSAQLERVGRQWIVDSG